MIVHDLDVRGDQPLFEAVTAGMSKDEVRDVLGEPLKNVDGAWLYRDTRQAGGYSYVYFDQNGWVSAVRGSMSFGKGLATP
jgi:hypothetical protein